MRNVLSNNHEVAHYWAHQLQPSGRSGNMRFEGPILYSYAEPIGYLLPDGRVWISNRNWSVTTSSHQSLARGATHHMERIESYALPPHEGWFETAHIDNRTRFKQQRELKFAEIILHPRRKKRLLGEIQGIINAQNNYRAFFSLDWPEATFEGCEADAKEAAEERAEQERRAEKRRKEIAAQRLLDEAERLEKWRKNELAYSAYFEATALRIRGDEVETTKGARIPLEHARRVWPLLKRLRNSDGVYRRNGHTLHLGHYAMDSFNADHKGTLIAGCHTIPWSEIEHIAQELGIWNLETNTSTDEMFLNATTNSNPNSTTSSNV